LSELSATLTKILKDFGGVEAVKIAKVLVDADDETTDELIAEQSKIKLNVVRKILYILNANKLTTFRRVRDKRSGWFIYYWQESFESLPEFLKGRVNEVIEKLDIRLKFEDENYFFVCNNGCPGRYIFIDALEMNFECPECSSGNLLEDRNSEKVTTLRNTIIKLRE
jgi:transcription initiation factor TFIIE subunit alpha